MRSGLATAVVLMLCFTAGSIFAAEEKNLTLVNYYGHFNLPPYEFLEGEKPAGFYIDFLRELERQTPVRFIITLLPWDKALERFSADPSAFICSAPSALSRVGITYTIPLAYHEPSLFIHIPGKISSLSDAPGKKIYTLQGTVPPELQYSHLYSMEAIGTECVSNALVELSRGRFDGVLAEQATGKFFLKKFKLTNVRELPLDRMSIPHSLITGSGNSRLIEILNNGISRIQTDSAYKKIHEAWFPSRQKPLPNGSGIPNHAIAVTAVFSLLIFMAGFWFWSVQHQVGKRTSALEKELLERLKAEFELKRERDFTAALFDASPSLVCVLNSHLKIVLVNETMAKTTGIPAEESKGKDFCEEFITLTDRDMVKQTLYSAGNGIETTMVFTCGFTGEGTIPIPVEWHFRPVVQNDQMTYLVGFGIDITERKVLENNLMTSSKIESISTLAGGIAHDFNNMLTAILGNLSILKERSVEAEISAIIEETETVSQKAMELTGQLLSFSQGDTSDKTVISVKKLVDGTLPFILSGSNIKYQVTARENSWPVSVNTTRITQVFYNLAMNSIQAMPSGGNLSIQIENIYLRDDRIYPLPQGKYVRITVSDDGPGIPPEYNDRIFDPYFSTKDSGRGLGLPMAFSIIKEHGGHIQYGEQSGYGSCFIILLPASEAPVVQPVEQPATGEIGGERVLVMDDEDMILKVAERMLVKLQLRVTTVPDGTSAISAYRESLESGDPFDVVIMDLTIPGGMGGKEAVVQLKQIDPDVKVIVSSGYVNDAAVSNHKAFGFTDVLMKPYQIDALRDVLKRVLLQ